VPAAHAKRRRHPNQFARPGELPARALCRYSAGMTGTIARPDATLARLRRGTGLLLLRLARSQ